jgi:hypothetical protein
MKLIQTRELQFTFAILLIDNAQKIGGLIDHNFLTQNFKRRLTERKKIAHIELKLDDLQL